jgi:hypothetical protein
MRTNLFCLFGIVMLGCAAPRMQTVSNERWQIVPAGQRAQIEQQQADELAAVHAEVQRASAELAAARKQAAARAIAMPSDAPPADADAATLAAWKDDHAARNAAFAEVDRARTAWLNAGVAWAQARLAAATAHVGEVQCETQLARAEAVDRNVGDDASFDTSNFSLQLGHARDSWSGSEGAEVAARAALDDAARRLIRAKAAYALLTRGSAQPVATVDPRRLPPHVGW